MSELVGLLVDLPVILLVHGVEHECRELSGVEGLLPSVIELYTSTAKTP